MNREPWPICLSFENDELFSSWLIRTSLENGSDPMTWTWFYWKGWRPWTVDLDRYCPNDKLLQISCSQFTDKQLEQATLAPTIKKILSYQPSLQQTWPWIIPLGIRNRERTGGLHFCPKCLQEKPIYFRKAWRYSWNHTCFKHNILLFECCPSCSNPLIPHKVDLDYPKLNLCKRCGFDLSSIIMEHSSNKVFQIQFLLNAAIYSEDIIFPWNIQNISELFATIRYFYNFINLATKRVVNSDIKLCKKLNIDTTLRSTKINTESLDKTPPNWMRELDCTISQLLAFNLDEIAQLFRDCGMSKESFHKTNYPISPTIQHILTLLPSNSRFMRKTASKINKIIYPKSKKEVREMWFELKDYLK